MCTHTFFLRVIISLVDLCLLCHNPVLILGRYLLSCLHLVISSTMLFKPFSLSPVHHYAIFPSCFRSSSPPIPLSSSHIQCSSLVTSSIAPHGVSVLSRYVIFASSTIFVSLILTLLILSILVTSNTHRDVLFSSTSILFSFAFILFSFAFITGTVPTSYVISLIYFLFEFHRHFPVLLGFSLVFSLPSTDIVGSK